MQSVAQNMTIAKQEDNCSEKTTIFIQNQMLPSLKPETILLHTCYVYYFVRLFYHQ